MKLIYSQLIDNLRGTLSTEINGKTFVFTDVTPCYMNTDAVVVHDYGNNNPIIVKDEKRIKWDREYTERLIEINRLYPPLKTLK